MNQPRFAYFDRFLPDWQDVRVLDVGCGGGFSCEFMAQRGAIVAGVDQSAPCIQSAKAHAVTTGLAIDYQLGTAENLPFDTQCFDAVVCVDVLEHIADLAQTIQEIHRVLKPGGFFFFDTINRTFQSKVMMIWLMENIMGEIPRGVHDWNKFIKPSELTALMQQTGFGDVSINGFSLFRETLEGNLQAYLNYKRTKTFTLSITQDPSVMYIGKAVKT
jgi:2-polyprenyl-6-hydroxyphenyl methylase/3-demethylubiquinone-9 3-methyltransferase